jgi:hypothetical protein
MDAFHTIAEIAATFVGFTGIIVAIQSSIGGSRSAVSVSSQRTLPGIFLPCLSAIIFAFLPEFVFGRPPETTSEWRILCGIFGVVHFFQTGTPLLTDRHGLNLRIKWIIGLSQIPVWLVLSVALGFLSEFAYRFYLFGLVWYLVIAMNSFLDFVRVVNEQKVP